MSLFRLGSYYLHSGDASPWKIDCDALSDSDWECLALMGVERLGRPFGSVFGVPRGGKKLALALEAFATVGPRLVVDDVLTTGASMEHYRATESNLGLVVFARGRCPSWVVPIFQM